MIVVGIEHRKFTNKEGKEVEFERVTMLYDINPQTGDGQGAVVVNSSAEKLNEIGLQVGDDVEPLYNKFGKIRRFEYVNK